MKLNRNRWTIAVVAVWVMVLALSTFLAPAPVDAGVRNMGWMAYTPNHPDGCAPLPFDCYVIISVPDN